jgi:hypothetical protein
MAKSTPKSAKISSTTPHSTEIINGNSPLTKGNKRLTRKFLGKLNDFVDNADKAFNKAMLKAYLKGNTNFFFGRNPDNTRAYRTVLQEYSYS